MGIEDRDYTRDSSDYTGTLTGFGLDYIPPVVKWLIIANVIVFLAQIFVSRTATEADWKRHIALQPEFMQPLLMSPKTADEVTSAERQRQTFLETPISLLDEWFALDARLVIFRGQIWRLLTYAFCHNRGELFHILLNMLALYWCGVTLESMLGPREFLLFYLAGAVFSGLVEVGIDLYIKSPLPVVGASGAVMSVAMLYAIHYPRNTVRLFWFWPLEVRWVVLLYALWNLHPLLLALSGNPAYYYTGTAHAAHLGGLAFGFLYWKFNLNFERWWDLIPKPRGAFALSGSGRRAPRRAGVRREPSIDEQVDEILRKIHDSGRESLTDAERRLLDRASQRYKDRREG